MYLPVQSQRIPIFVIRKIDFHEGRLGRTLTRLLCYYHKKVKSSDYTICYFTIYIYGIIINLSATVRQRFHLIMCFSYQYYKTER